MGKNTIYIVRTKMGNIKYLIQYPLSFWLIRNLFQPTIQISYSFDTSKRIINSWNNKFNSAKVVITFAIS